MTKSRGIAPPRKRWTHEQLQTLRREFPNRLTAEVARLVGHSYSSTSQKALSEGLHKSPEFLGSAASGRLRPGDTRGISGRFQKGQAPANKGLRRPGWGPGRMRETQFRSGTLNGKAARLWVPIGSHRINSDGNLDRKVRDDGPPQKRWEGVHRLVWKDAHGSIPSGFAVTFKPGRHTTELEKITLDALELVSRQDLMRRNSYHTRYPKEIGRLIQLRGAVIRQINKRARDEK